MSKTERNFALLSSSNWGQWADNMEAYLSTKELWEYVDGSTPEPTPTDPAKPTTDEKTALTDWKRKCAKVSGELWLAIEDSQKVHVKETSRNVEETGECPCPKEAWCPLQCL
jgi:hypothetical protein